MSNSDTLSSSASTPNTLSVEVQAKNQNPAHDRLSSEQGIFKAQPTNETKANNNTEKDSMKSCNYRPSNIHNQSVNRRRRQQPYEKYLENQKVLQSLYQSERFVKYFVIKSTTEESLAETDVIKANRQLKEILEGTPEGTSELRNGTLLVEVKNMKQSQNIHKIKCLNNIPVEVEAHARLNTVQGTIYYRNKPRYSTEKVLDELNSQDVTNVYRIKRRVNGIMEDTNIYILTFKQCSLPEDVHIGWTKCSVREYIPNPRRCFTCQKFGHGAASCRATAGICVRCGGAAHGSTCDKPISCSNCGEKHLASSRDCFYYILEKEIITLQTREKLPYPKAKRIAADKLVKSPTSYAAITAKNRTTLRNIPVKPTLVQTPKLTRAEWLQHNTIDIGSVTEVTDISSLTQPSEHRRDNVAIPDMDTDDQTPTLAALETENVAICERENEAMSVHKKRSSRSKNEKSPSKHIKSKELQEFHTNKKPEESKRPKDTKRVNNKEVNNEQVAHVSNISKVTTTTRVVGCQNASMLQTTPISTIITRNSTTGVEPIVTRDDRKRASSPTSSGDNHQGPPVKRHPGNKSPSVSRSSSNRRP